MHLSGTVHIVRGDESALPEIDAWLREIGIGTDANPDIYRRVYSHFGIEDAREIADRAAGRALRGGQRAFILATPVLTVEAQNALLKTLEDVHAHFFLVVPSPEMLLATLRSRAQIVEPRGALGFDARAFLKSSPRVRLEELKRLLEKGDDERRDVGAVLAFLAALERALARAKLDSGIRDGLEAVYLARSYALDKGALLKPLLEHVALRLPVL